MRRVVAARLCRSLRRGFRCEETGTHHGVGEGIERKQFWKPPPKKDGWILLGDAFWLFSP